MKHNFLHGIMALMMGMMVLYMQGCKADVDLNKIDTTMDANLGLALPVGSMVFTINDFFGGGQVPNLFIDSLNNKGVLTYCDSFSLSRSFHDIDLSKYVSATEKRFNVYDKLDEKGLIEDGKITGMGLPISLEFPLTLTLNGINKDSTIEDERIDSLIITNANFISAINCENFQMDWNWIDKVELILGDAFCRPEGNRLTIYEKGQPGDWYQDLPIDVDQFSMCLMKDKGISKPKAEKTFFWYSNNVVDTCNFRFIFTFTVPLGQVVQIPQDARYRYRFRANFLDYTAVWGYFNPSKDMRDEDTVIIANEWETWKYFQNIKLPVAQPRVDLHVTTQVVGAMRMVGEYLFVENATTKEQKYATFDLAMTQRQRVEDATTLKYLDVESQIGDSVHNIIPFSEAWNEGHIDQLFTIRPDILGWKYYIEFDKYKTPQSRINKGGSNMNMLAIATLPFTFNQGISLDYSDTIPDVNLSQLSLDSLLIEAKWLDTLKTSDLKLVLTVNNTLPLRVRGVFQFLDKDGKQIPDPSNPELPIRFSEQDTLCFNTPSYNYSQDMTAYMSEPGISTFTLTMDKQHFQEFARIKRIQFHAIIDDETMRYVYEQDRNFRAKITNQSSIKMQIGVAANVDAIINLQRINK